MPPRADTTTAGRAHRGAARRGAPVIGIVGGGQLARMTYEAASALGVGVVVLAERVDDAAAAIAHDVVIGTPDDAAAMRALAGRCEVVTFDHEQVDTGVLAALEDAGVPVRPGPGALAVAIDKSVMRMRLERAGLPSPAYRILSGDAEAAGEEVASFAPHHAWPVVIKAARGGYDGKGVWPVADEDEAREVCERAAASGTPLLVEEHVAIEAELAVVVARRPSGTSVAWPPVETAQTGGVCREVLYPGRLDDGLRRQAAELARRVADVVGAVGVFAVELFWSGGRLLVNEVAARPHNSAHWTIEGSVTSQFENHVRAVLDLPLGETRPVARAVATVNVFGAPSTGDGDSPPPPAGLVRRALAVPGAHVHLYGKEPRPGRKLGHVTVCGDDAPDVRRRAWQAATALGTPHPAALDLGASEEAARPAASAPAGGGDAGRPVEAR